MSACVLAPVPSEPGGLNSTPAHLRTLRPAKRLVRHIDRVVVTCRFHTRQANKEESTEKPRGRRTPLVARTPDYNAIPMCVICHRQETAFVFLVQRRHAMPLSSSDIVGKTEAMRCDAMRWDGAAR
jgi:hypothetical protein